MYPPTTSLAPPTSSHRSPRSSLPPPSSLASRTGEATRYGWDARCRPRWRCRCLPAREEAAGGRRADLGGKLVHVCGRPPLLTQGMEEPVTLPPNIEDVPPPGLALVEELDKLLLVQVRTAADAAAAEHEGACFHYAAASAAAAPPCTSTPPTHPPTSTHPHLGAAVAGWAQDSGHAALL